MHLKLQKARTGWIYASSCFWQTSRVSTFVLKIWQEKKNSRNLNTTNRLELFFVPRLIWHWISVEMNVKMKIGPIIGRLATAIFSPRLFLLASIFFLARLLFSNNGVVYNLIFSTLGMRGSMLGLKIIRIEWSFSWNYASIYWLTK